MMWCLSDIIRVVLPIVEITPLPPQRFLLEFPTGTKSEKQNFCLEVSLKSLAPFQVEIQVKEGVLPSELTVERITDALTMCKSVPLFSRWMMVHIMKERRTQQQQ